MGLAILNQLHALIRRTLMKSRSLAVLSDKIIPLKVNQFIGMPPELSGGNDKRELQGLARFLVIEEAAEGFFLYRYSKNGECVGDTWHLSEEDAKEQASYEYGKGAATWISIPENVLDAAKYALANLE